MGTVHPPPATVRPNLNETPEAFKNGETLYLQACGVGRTEIRIEEFYYDHPIQHYRAIRVEQADLVSDHRATAVLLPASNEYDSPEYTLTTTDVDYFRFDLDRAALVEVFSSGMTDTHGTLEDAWGNWMDADDDGGTGQNFKLSKGTSYRARITSASGAISRIGATPIGCTCVSEEAEHAARKRQYVIPASISNWFTWENRLLTPGGTSAAFQRSG